MALAFLVILPEFWTIAEFVSLMQKGLHLDHFLWEGAVCSTSHPIYWLSPAYLQHESTAPCSHTLQSQMATNS